jgi:hypothetical protein
MLLAASPLLAVGRPVSAAGKPATLDQHAQQVDQAANTQGEMQVAGKIADQLNAAWAPNPPAYTAESVAQQRGPDQLGGFGSVLIGNLIIVKYAKLNNLTLAAATQVVMDRRHAPGGGWGKISQDLLGGQKLGDLMKNAQQASAAVTTASRSVEKGPKGVGMSSGKAPAKTDQAFSNAFDSPRQATGVAVSGPGVGGGTGRGHDKDISGKDVGSMGGGPGAAERGGSEGHGGGPGGGNGGGGGGKGH